MLIRHLWRLKIVVFLHWCLICIVLFEISKAVFLLAKISTIGPAIVTRDYTYLGHLGQRDSDGIISICFALPKVAKASKAGI